MSQGLSADAGLIVDRQVTLADGAAVAVDASLGAVFDLTTTQNFTLSNPTNPTSGQKIIFRIKQGGAGSFVLTLDTKYRTPSDLTGSILSTATGTMDILGFVYNLADDKWDWTGITKGYV